MVSAVFASAVARFAIMGAALLTVVLVVMLMFAAVAAPVLIAGGSAMPAADLMPALAFILEVEVLAFVTVGIHRMVFVI
ncbi:hypothetical protein [Lentibacillus kimchii]|uniref:hypothetical protein n=1 Tax=Lentibacillus kimchii TaxID=1542911 RepID=UPI0036D41FD0